MAPSTWGFYFWGTLHLACLHKTIGPEFIIAFADALPCPACRTHFKELIVDFPPEKAEDLFEWSVMVHNEVNRRIGWPEVGLQTARDLWLSRSKPRPDPWFKWYLIIGIILLIVLFFLFKR